MVMNSVFVENRDEHLVVIHADEEILLDYEVFPILSMWFWFPVEGVGS
jgi:hypothetical protein